MQKRLLNRMFHLALAGAMLVTPGCSSSQSAASSDSSGSAGGTKTELVLWHTFTEHHEAKLQEIIADFNASQDQVTVTALTQPETNFASKVYEAAASGTGPDIVLLDASSAADYVDAGLALDFSQYIDVENYKSRVSDGIYTEGTSFSQPGLYTITIHSTGPVYFYNKTLFDSLGLQAPETWDDVISNSQTIYEQTGIVGFAVDSLTDFGQEQLMQNGVAYVDTTTNTVPWDDPSTTEWLTWFKEGVQAGYFQLSPTTGDYNSGDLSGKVLASYIGSSAGIDYIDLGDDELACCPVPQTEGGTKWAQIWTRNIIGFRSDDEAKNQAIADFAMFFTNTENSSAWTQVFGSISSYEDVLALPEYQTYLQDNIALQAIQAQASYAGSLPVIQNSSTLYEELKKMITQSASGATDIETAIQNAVTTCDKALQS